MNTAVILEAGALHEVLQSNKQQLIANSMLEKGQPREAAEGEIGLLLDLLTFLRDAQVSLKVSEAQLTLDAEIQFNVEQVQ